jgi:alginate O-acetyltransferase complex protein AlgI
MVLGGLWHGARLNFLLWGLYHGLLLALQRAFLGKAEPGATRRGRVVGVVVTFHLTLLGWLLFRVETMQQLGRMVRGLAFSWEFSGAATRILITMVPLVVPLLVVEIVQGRARTSEIFPRPGWPARAFVFGLLLSAVLLLNRGASTPFLYFQF